MGVCCSHKECLVPATKNSNTSAITHLLFPRTARIHILCKDDRQRVITDDHLQVTLTEPAAAFSQPINMGKWQVWASGEC